MALDCWAGRWWEEWVSCPKGTATVHPQLGGCLAKMGAVLQNVWFLREARNLDFHANYSDCL